MADDAKPTKPLLIYDGDCEFCRHWIARWQFVTHDRVDYQPYQDVAHRFNDIPREAFAEAVHLIEPDGCVTRGAEAVYRVLAMTPGKRLPLWCHQHLPGFARASEVGYAFVARNRRLFSAATRWVWGAPTAPSTFFMPRWIFLRGLAVIYLLAFVSLGVQILGLVGSDGILPAAEYLDAVAGSLGSERIWRLPTLAWLGASDEALQLMCSAGAVLSVLLFFRIAPAPILLLLWVLYLSLVNAGGVFLRYQWDMLLLETGLLAVFFAPWKILPRLSGEPPPSRIALWLGRLLLFRLMFASGVVKLNADDPNNPVWHVLTALNVHYETQPIPTWIGWYAHQLPDWFQKFSVATMFFIELVVPFLIFTTRRPRICACICLMLFQVLIAMTGNYNFFNLLAALLCVLLVDDAFLRRLLPNKMTRHLAGDVFSRRHPLFQTATTGLFAVLVLWISIPLTVRQLSRGLELPESVSMVYRKVAPFRSINTYGLFARMTVDRPEIVIEGTNDGRTWSAYEFKWKPGDPSRPPGFVAPHQPRLDWQMWFAALRSYERTGDRWFPRFLGKLLEGSPAVLELLETNPFPEAPPRWIRAVLYDYRFTDPATRRAESLWWARHRVSLYAPPVGLRRPSD